MHMSTSSTNQLPSPSVEETDESHETAGSALHASEMVVHKTRRPHRKSRYGCTRCKVRRIKLEQILPPPEVDLFRHFLEHTSRDRTVGDQDRYTMQVGIPNLACQSKPLMRSVLALAAVCRCCDIIRDEPSRARTPSGRGEIVELLSLAHRYHLGSLREIQATLCEADNYDHVLANAAMMGMYGSASYAARVWLAKTAPPGEQLHLLDCMMLPGTPQWLSLFRAVRLAYAGLLRNSPQHSPAISPAALSTQYEYKSLLPPQASGSSAPSTPGHDDDDAARFPVVTDIANDSVGRLAHISPWLRRYTASISSMIPSQVPRRVIMSLVHKVPTAFLNLVEDMINLINAGPAAAGAGAGGRPMPEPSAAHQLALEIFANWLVLVILLDDVWWIGGIGAWELARFVSVRSYPGWEACLWNRDRDWWPESMLTISRQFEKHR
ncbi:hypothetical protein MYCTH_97378 [Thermothelomyces thermophilus ATCC 42464]|uniref:C6 transcription factor n=1 Tax=Thermothelomyces thermophilus (strain ATCC 42464 / BCRC 31852 / DSM 1799) TaxID=573729 RepID=G2Q783_THET4|nr:uncharacterized protein MYCTH_97378 [Thermothelomyces thermophilus ATCC 42464]AEO55661.1 hypothetical protein MYCTH_97378 [Thermothelomyces thermophilus ATCC 42464]